LKFVSFDLDIMTEVVACIVELIFIVEALMIPVLYTEYAIYLCLCSWTMPCSQVPVSKPVL